MTDNIKDKSPANPKMLSIEELRTYPGNENKSEAELFEQAEFLREYSLILYQVYIKQASQEKRF